MNFNNQVYENMIGDIINDTFYLEGRSLRGSIAGIRTYAEVIVRKLLDRPETEFVTLGKNKIQKLIDNLPNNLLLTNTIDKIRVIGNDYTHTQKTSSPTNEEFLEVKENLLELISFLFVQYFEKHPFNSNPAIKRHFSLLPPNIRERALRILYDKTPLDITVIDKLSLAILKNKNIEAANEWIESNKNNLEKLSCVSEKAKREIKDTHGKAYLNVILDGAPENMYLCVKRKVKHTNQTLISNGKRYETFEQAKTMYISIGHLDGNYDYIREFNGIMDFVFLGRSTDNTTNIKNGNSYVVTTFSS